MNQLTDFNENHRYQLHSSSPPPSLSVNNSFTHQTSSATMNSWGFDVDRLSNKNNDQQTMKDYNDRFVDISSSSSPQNFQLRTPMLTRQRHGNEFSAVDRLVRGPNRIESSQQHIIPTNQHKTQREQELLAWQNRMLERWIEFFEMIFD